MTAEEPAAGWELLLRTVGALVAGRPDALAGLSAADWQALRIESDLHWLSPLLHRALGDHRPPVAVRRGLKKGYLLARACSRRSQAVHLPILAALDAAGIPVILLKGMDLATQLYDDPSTRPMMDADLLVRRADVLAAADILRACGYRQRSADIEARGAESRPGKVQPRQYHLAPFFAAKAPSIELHVDIQAPERLSDAAVDGLWQRARPVHIGGVAALVLAPEDVLLHLCSHAGFHHGFGVKLLGLCDVLLVLERRGDAIDWPALWRRAREWQAERSVLLCLALLRWRMGCVLPEGAWPSAPPWTEAERRRLLDEAEVQMRAKAAELDRRRQLVRSRRASATEQHGQRIGFRQRLLVIGRRAFVPKAELARWFDLGHVPSWIHLLYPVRLWLILWQRNRRLLDRFLRKPIVDDGAFGGQDAWTIQLRRERLVAWLGGGPLGV